MYKVVLLDVHHVLPTPVYLPFIRRGVMPEHPIGYDIPNLAEDERYRGAWWRNIVRPGLAALPDVEPPARGASKWRY